MFPLPVALALLRGAYSSESYGPIMAGAALSALPLLLVFLVANRRIVEGVRLSGLKRARAAEHPALALPDSHALGVEILHQRNGVPAADAEEVLHVGGAHAPSWPCRWATSVSWISWRAAAWK